MSDQSLELGFAALWQVRNKFFLIPGSSNRQVRVKSQGKKTAKVEMSSLMNITDITNIIANAMSNVIICGIINKRFTTVK